MRYLEVSKEELQNIRPALALLERVHHEMDSEIADYTIYGIVTKPLVLTAAQETEEYWADMDEEESAPQFREIALSIPMSSDNLYYLTGSGLYLHDITFAFFGGEDEGVRTRRFEANAAHGVKIHLDDFNHLALADGDVWLDSYLQNHGNKYVANKEVVQRDEEATLNTVPALEEEPKETVPPEVPPVRKTTSYEGLEDWFLK